MPRKILIADDEKVFRVTLKDLLEKEGYGVALAVNGSTAIEKVKQDDYDVALVDVVMPDMDGIRVLEEIRESSPETRVIMITGFGTVENAVEAMKKGASNYILKPFKNGEIEGIVKRVLMEAKFEKGEENPFEIFGNLTAEGRPGMCIGGRPELLETYELEDSAVPLPGTLGELKNLIDDFVGENGNAVILVYGFEYFLARTPIGNIENFVSEMNSLPSSTDVIVTYNPTEVDAKLLGEFMLMMTDPYTHLISEIFASPIRRDIIRYLHGRTSIFTKIKQQLAIKDGPTLSFHFKSLKSAGVIGQEEKRYFLTDKGIKLSEILSRLDEDGARSMQNVMWLKSD